MCTLTGDFESAKKYYRMVELLKDGNKPVDVYMSGYNLSLILARQGEAAAAIKKLEGLARYAKDKKMPPRFVCFAYQDIANAYCIMNRPDLELKYMLKCDSAASRNNIQHTFATTLKNLADTYEEKGNLVKANMYKSRYLEIMDSVYNTREFDMAKNTLFAYEVEKTTNEMAALHEREAERLRTIRQQRIVMGAVSTMLLVTALFLLTVWRQKRRINRNYADLYSVNRDFVDTQAQLTERLRKNREALKEKDERIALLTERIGKTADTHGGDAKAQPKYHASNLTEEQRLILADAIQNVMENTTEFCDCNFSLDTLAKLVGSNTTYVSQVINDTYHKSFSNYVNPYRIHLACARLVDREGYGNLTMKAVGESVGFKSYTSFVNTFRKITGMTPALYLKMAGRESRS